MVVFNVQLTKEGSKLPTKAHKDDACFDLYSPEDFCILPGEIVFLNLGIRISMDSGWEAQIRSRSSVGFKKRVNIVHKIGTIDAGYRNDIYLPLINEGEEAQFFYEGDKLAQMKFSRVPEVTLKLGDISYDTERGIGGFGSSGC